MATKIQTRRDTAANWTSANPTLSAGEFGWESDTGYMKIGDGTTAWSGLSYFTPSGADANTTYTVGVAQNAANADITLDGSDASTDTLSLVAGTKITLTVAGDNITIASDNDLANYDNSTSAFLTSGTLDLSGKSINELTDVNVTGPGSGDHLYWNGSNWINEAVYFYSTKRFAAGMATDRFTELRNGVITIGSISSGDVVDFNTNSGSDYGIEWLVNNPGTDFVANLTPGPVNINSSTYFRIIIDNTSGATKGSISGIQRLGVTQTVNWMEGSMPTVSGEDIYDIYDIYCFRGDGGSDETWYARLVTGNTFNNLADTDLTSVDTNDLIYMGSSGKLEADSILRSLYTFGEINMLQNINHNMEWDTASYSGTDGDTITFDIGSYISSGTSGRIYFEDVDHNFTLDITNLSTINKVSQKFLVAVDNRQRQETRVDSGTVSPLAVPSLGQTLIINGVTVTASGAGTTSFIDDINAAGITNVRAESLTNAIRIVGENNTSITLDAGGTAMSDLGLSAGTTTPTTVGSPGKGLTGLKINSRDVTIVWADGKVPTAKLGRIDFYEIERMNGPTYADLDICFIRHFNRDQDLSGDLTGSVFAEDSTVLVDGLQGKINLDQTVMGDISLLKSVSGTGQTFGSFVAETGSTEYNKIDFKTGPDAFADNGEVTWSTRVQGSLTEIFEIKGSSVGKSGIAVNPNSNAEVDFLVSGSSDATLFVVDAGDDNVGVGKYPTQGKLDVDGDVYATTYYGDGSNLTGISGGGGLSDVVDDTTPQLGGSLDVNGQDIVSVSNGNITFTPNGAGVVRIDGTNGIDMESGAISIKNAGAESYVRFYCEVSNAHYTQLQAAPHADYSGNVTVTLPATATRLVGRSTTDTLTNKTFGDKTTFEGGVIEGFSDLTGATGVVAHDTSNGHIFRHTSIAADFTANFTNLGLTNDHGTMVSLMLVQGGTAYIPTAVQIGGAAQTILWQGGSPPSGTSSGTDIVSFSITQSGGSYTVLGQLTSYS
jgi:hypothetical protein